MCVVCPLTQTETDTEVNMYTYYLSTQVNVIDAAAMGEVLDTFTVCTSPIHCIATVPEFNENDPDVLTSKPPLTSITCAL